MNINLIRKQLVCLLLLGAMSVSVAGNKKVFNAAAGKYDCTLDGSYTVNTGTISEYFLDGTAALMRLPRGKGKGKTQFTIADVLFNYKFKINRVKVSRNKKKVRYWGVGSLVNADAGINADGIIRITAKRKGRNKWIVRSRALMSGVYADVAPMEVNTKINGKQR